MSSMSSFSLKLFAKAAGTVMQTLPCDAEFPDSVWKLSFLPLPFAICCSPLHAPKRKRRRPFPGSHGVPSNSSLANREGLSGKDNLTFSLVKLCVTGRVTRLVLVFLRFPVQPAPCQPPHRAFAGGSYSTACSAALSFEWKNAPTTSPNLG